MAQRYKMIGFQVSLNAAMTQNPLKNIGVGELFCEGQRLQNSVCKPGIGLHAFTDFRVQSAAFASTQITPLLSGHAV